MSTIEASERMAGRIGIKEFRDRLGYWMDAVRNGRHVILTSFGRDRAVLISIDEYRRLKQAAGEGEGE